MAAIVDMDGVGGGTPQGWDASKFVPLIGPVADAVTEAFWRRAPFAKLVKELSGCFGGFNGMGKVTLEWEIVEESKDDPLSDTSLKPIDTSMGMFRLESIPLPITHSDAKKTTNALGQETTEGAVRASNECADAVESMFLGTREPFGYRGSKVYGVLTYPNRQTVTHEVFAGTHEEQQASRMKLIEDMISFQQRDNFFGPWVLLHGKDWNNPLDQSFGKEYPHLRAAILDLPANKVERIILAIQFVANPDWPADAVALVQMTPEVIQTVEGLPVGAFPWGDGYKVATICVPQIRSDYEGRCGICVARSEVTDQPVVYDEADTPLVR